MSNTCTYVLKCGPNAGNKCGEPTKVNETLCDRCISRDNLTHFMVNEFETFEQTCQHSDPYNGEPCCRPAVYKTYCFLCLSNY